MRNLRTYPWIILLVIMTLSCKSQKSSQPPKATASSNQAVSFTPIYKAGPRLIIYKTKADYSDLVPIQLSADGKEIISYPAPQDIANKNNFGKPTMLNGSWFVDAQGIGIHTAYLTTRLEDYSKLDKTPSLSAMMAQIKTADPFEEMYDAGLKTPAQVQLIEQAIANKQLNLSALKRITK